MNLDAVTGGAILKILDSWDWNDEAAHIDALREKLKSYLRFIETGELLDVLPQGAGKPVVIEVVGRFPLTDAATKFLEAASSIASDVETSIRFTQYS